MKLKSRAENSGVFDLAPPLLRRRQDSASFCSNARKGIAIMAETAFLKPGTPAPAFTLHTTADQTVSLSDFRGQPVILAFYPADWSPVCGDQMAVYNEILPEFRKHRAVLLGISVDGVWCHDAFAQNRRLHFPLHDLLYENQAALADPDLRRYAGALGLDITRFVNEPAGRTWESRVREDFMSGVRSGVNGTPTFFVNGAPLSQAERCDTGTSAIDTR
jgi:thiol-disulfide isomerase/thioredoxin